MQSETIELSNGKLSKSMIKQYKEDGFLFPINIFKYKEVLNLRTELEEIEQKYSKIKLPKPLNDYKRGPANAVIPLVADIAKDNRILNVVECIIGSNILVWAAEFFIKEKKQTILLECIKILHIGVWVKLLDKSLPG